MSGDRGDMLAKLGGAVVRWLCWNDLAMSKGRLSDDGLARQRLGTTISRLSFRNTFNLLLSIHLISLILKDYISID